MGKTEVIASTIGKSNFSAFLINEKPQTFMGEEKFEVGSQKTEVLSFSIYNFSFLIFCSAK